ncbi:MAG TPA: glycine cleavage system protein H, partial [Vicinamibacteria bacterium]|nr:glycine cleavage system protein H [Vicinamibacteria bacterium]
PVAGEVTEVNSALAQGPEKINTDPYGEAWMVRLRLADPGAVSRLMDAAAYKAFVASESK